MQLPEWLQSWSRATVNGGLEMLYLHWVTMFPGKWLDEPERAGFLSACDGFED